MQIRATVQIPKALQGFAKFDNGVSKAVAKWAANTSNSVQDYPRQLPHVKYRRTGRYGSGWRIQKTTTQAKVYNSVSYADYLAGKRQVGWAKARGWKNLATVASENKAILLDDLKAAMHEALL